MPHEFMLATAAVNVAKFVLDAGSAALTVYTPLKEVKQLVLTVNGPTNVENEVPQES